MGFGRTGCTRNGGNPPCTLFEGRAGLGDGGFGSLSGVGHRFVWPCETSWTDWIFFGSFDCGDRTFCRNRVCRGRSFDLESVSGVSCSDLMNRLQIVSWGDDGQKDRQICLDP